MAIQQRTYTIEEFEAFLAKPENKDCRFELINGYIVEKTNHTASCGVVKGNIAAAIMEFVKPLNLGRVGISVDHQMPDDHFNVRQPDVSFIGGIRPIVKVGFVSRMPDLAVEVKSPDDTYNEMREKAKYYLANGCRMVILIFPEKRMVEVYAPDVDVEILLEHETISGRDVLPGCTLAVRDIFKDPLEANE